MTTEYTGFKIGEFVSPIVAATTNPLLQDADPALNTLSAFYRAVLVSHLGARFDAEVAKSGLTGKVGTIAANFVPYNPVPYLTQTQLQFPLLALFVTGETIHDVTSNVYQSKGEWTLQWILPHLTAAQCEQLHPILRAVAKVIVAKTCQGYDTEYLTGTQILALAGIGEIELGKVTFGTMNPPTTNLFFPTVEIELIVTENKNETPGLLDFEGVDGNIKVADPQGSQSLIDFSTELS